MTDELVGDVRYSGLRGEVIDALELFMTLSPENVDQRPGDLTIAVHGLVDDTFWDVRDPADDVGYRLRDNEEVAAIKVVLEPLLVVLDQLGPVRPHLEYVSHPRWPDVMTSARTAHRLLVTNDTTPS